MFQKSSAWKHSLDARFWVIWWLLFVTWERRTHDQVQNLLFKVRNPIHSWLKLWPDPQSSLKSEVLKELHCDPKHVYSEVRPTVFNSTYLKLIVLELGVTAQLTWKKYELHNTYIFSLSFTQREGERRRGVFLVSVQIFLSSGQEHPFMIFSHFNKIWISHPRYL